MYDHGSVAGDGHGAPFEVYGTVRVHRVACPRVTVGVFLVKLFSAETKEKNCLTPNTFDCFAVMFTACTNYPFTYIRRILYTVHIHVYTRTYISIHTACSIVVHMVSTIKLVILKRDRRKYFTNRRTKRTPRSCSVRSKDHHRRDNRSFANRSACTHIHTHTGREK